MLSANSSSRSTVLSIYLPAFVLAMGVSIALPALPLYAKSFQVDFSTASMILVANQFGGLVGTLPTGYLVDRIGGRKLALIGPIVVGVCALLMSFAQVVEYVDARDQTVETAGILHHDDAPADAAIDPCFVLERFVQHAFDRSGLVARKASSGIPLAGRPGLIVEVWE